MLESLLSTKNKIRSLGEIRRSWLRFLVLDRVLVWADLIRCPDSQRGRWPQIRKFYSLEDSKGSELLTLNLKTVIKNSEPIESSRLETECFGVYTQSDSCGYIRCRTISTYSVM